jgi:hypothetical protein
MRLMISTAALTPLPVKSVSTCPSPPGLLERDREGEGKKVLGEKEQRRGGREGRKGVRKEGGQQGGREGRKGVRYGKKARWRTTTYDDRDSIIDEGEDKDMRGSDSA